MFSICDKNFMSGNQETHILEEEQWGDKTGQWDDGIEQLGAQCPVLSREDTTNCCNSSSIQCYKA